MTTAPALFISHGAPTFALEPGLLGPRLSSIGERLDNVKALLVVSPHWQTEHTAIMTTPYPPTLHDYGGFPRELYRIEHPAIGHPSLATEIGQSLADTGRRCVGAAAIPRSEGADSILSGVAAKQSGRCRCRAVRQSTCAVAQTRRSGHRVG